MANYKFNFIELAKVTANELYDSSVNYLVAKYNQSRRVFSLASGYGQIIQVLQELTQLNLYYIEDSVNELNIRTATRDQNIMGLTTINGHKPTRAISSKGQLELSWNGANSEIIINSLVIQNHVKLTCDSNSLAYFLQFNNDSLNIQLDQTAKYLCDVIQGTIEVQQFQSDGSRLQSYYVQIGSKENIENYMVKVYVNSIQWKIYDEFYDMPRNAKAVYVKTGVLPGLDVIFGNGDFGEIPAAGSIIQVEYVKTNGSYGDLDPGINHTWTFNEPGYNQFGEEMDLNSSLTVKTKIPPSFGSNGEDIELTKIIGTRNSRNYVLVSPDNYIIFFEKFNVFSIVRAWIDEALDNNIIYLMLVPDIKKRITSGENYFSIPLDRFLLTKHEKDRVLELLDESGSKIIGTSNAIVDVPLKKYIMNINLKIFEGYEVDDAKGIKTNVVNVISDYMLKFTRKDALPKSDFTFLIEDIEGVDSVSINILSEENEIFKSNPSNLLLEDKGLDEFGDIIFEQGELPVIRGNWTDRNGIYYQDLIDFSKPCPINISIKSITKNDYLSQKR